MKKVIMALTWLAAILTPVTASAVRIIDDGKLKYQYNPDLYGYEVCGYIEDVDTLRIPQTYEGTVVITGIADKAFAGMKSLVCAIIPTNIDHIGANLFTGCTSLESIVIESSEKELNGEGALFVNNEYGYVPIKSIYIGRQCNKVSLDSGILEEVTYSKNVSSTCCLIGNACKNLQRVTIEDGYKEFIVGESSFFGQNSNGIITWKYG